MKNKLHFYLIGILIALAIIGIVYSVNLNDANESATKSTDLSVEEATALGAQAYIYGYPLVTMDMTRRVLTNVTEPTSRAAPLGQFANMPHYPDASFKEVTAPNADTLYSFAWLDLAQEPYIFHIPNEKDRYFLMPILSAWTNVIADPGTRVGTKNENFAIVGPQWKGKLPVGVKEIKSPTNMVWILGRTYSTGTPEDYQAVHAIQKQYTLVPLSAYGKSYTPPKGSVDSSVDMQTPVRKQITEMDAGTYFKKLALLLKENPPAPEDAAMVEKLKVLGIESGKDFDINKVDSNIAKGLEKSLKVALKQLMAYQKEAGKKINGWMMLNETGKYGANYLNRAFVTALGLGANLPQDAIYPETKVDADGNKLNGKNKYIMHFAQGQLPPVKGFWSLTMYDDQYYFVENPISRYAISARNDLKTNADGSVDLYIQQESPGADKESNWLPAPASDFTLMLRLYWPEETIINGTWKPPAIQKIK